MTPTRSTSILTTSPSRKNFGGSKYAATPLLVPVAMMSPGSRVQTVLIVSIWSQQSNEGYSPDLTGDDFWQHNIFLGYRFLQRRAEARVGILNIADQEYQLNPLTLYNELPRERTLTLSLKLFF